jgi:hypothetical protein
MELPPTGVRSGQVSTGRDGSGHIRSGQVYKKASLVEKIDFNVLFALQVVFSKTWPFSC